MDMKLVKKSVISILVLMVLGGGIVTQVQAGNEGDEGLSSEQPLVKKGVFVLRERVDDFDTAPEGLAYKRAAPEFFVKQLQRGLIRKSDSIISSQQSDALKVKQLKEEAAKYSNGKEELKIFVVLAANNEAKREELQKMLNLRDSELKKRDPALHPLVEGDDYYKARLAEAGKFKEIAVKTNNPEKIQIVQSYFHSLKREQLTSQELAEILAQLLQDAKDGGPEPQGQINFKRGVAATTADRLEKISENDLSTDSVKLNRTKQLLEADEKVNRAADELAKSYRISRGVGKVQGVLDEQSGSGASDTDNTAYFEAYFAKRNVDAKNLYKKTEALSDAKRIEKAREYVETTEIDVKNAQVFQDAVKRYNREPPAD